MLLLLGRDRFGEPSAKIVALLDAVTDLGRLEALMIRLLHVKTWEELLGVNGTTRPRAAEEGVNNAQRSEPRRRRHVADRLRAEGVDRRRRMARIVAK